MRTDIFSRLAKDKIKTFAVGVLVVSIIGTFFIHERNLQQKIYISKDVPLEAALTLSSSEISVTEDLMDASQLHTTIASVNVKNNTRGTFTGVRLVVPSIGLGAFESPSAVRSVLLFQKGINADSVFKIADILPEGTASAMIFLYGGQMGTYQLKVYIETDEQLIATTNSVSLEVN